MRKRLINPNYAAELCELLRSLGFSREQLYNIKGDGSWQLKEPDDYYDMETGVLTLDYKIAEMLNFYFHDILMKSYTDFRWFVNTKEGRFLNVNELDYYEIQYLRRFVPYDMDVFIDREDCSFWKRIFDGKNCVYYDWSNALRKCVSEAMAAAEIFSIADDFGKWCSNDDNIDNVGFVKWGKYHEHVKNELTRLVTLGDSVFDEPLETNPVTFFIEYKNADRIEKMTDSLDEGFIVRREIRKVAHLNEDWTSFRGGDVISDSVIFEKMVNRPEDAEKYVFPTEKCRKVFGDEEVQRLKQLEAESKKRQLHFSKPPLKEYIKTLQSIQ